ncbi:MAG: methyl-accepting chemotaxis protein [Candidatus Latescibacterota bacterium]|jgi:methyl-accepting chemotaxis protein
MARKTKSNPLGLELEILESSFAALAPQAEALVARFYEVLFEKFPAVKPMFTETDIEKQQKKLLDSLVLVVNNLRNPDKLVPALQALGKKHQNYGAVAEHYGAVAEVLVEVMAEFAGDLWSDEVEAAWSDALQLVANVMLDAYTANEEENDMAPVDNQLFNMLPVPAFTVDERGTVLLWNNAISELTGRDADDVVGKKAWAGFADKKKRTPIEEALMEEEAVEAEFEVIHAESGETTSVTFSAIPTCDEDGEVTGIVATLVSGGNATENADRQGQIDAINKVQAVIEFNLDGTIITANDNFLNVLGYTLNEVQGQHHRMFVEPEYAQSAEYQQFWAMLNRGEFQSAEYKRIGKGGNEVWIQASYNPIFDLKGTPFKVVKFATDVTEQKLKNANFEGQIEAIGKAQAVIEFNLDGTIIIANDNFLNTLGYTLTEIQGQHHRMFVEKDYAESTDYKQFWDVLNLGEFQSGDFKRISKSGEEIWIAASYNPIFDLNNKPFKVVKFATDITEQKKASILASAVEGSATAMMMVDKNRVITSVNPQTVKMLQTNLTTFQKVFSGFNMDKIIGTCIDVFHENPDHQARILADPNNLPYQADIEVGDLKFSLNVSAMRDIQGNHIGSALEWADVTAVRAKAEEAASLSSVVKGCTAMFMLCDPDLVITYANPAVVEMLSLYEGKLREAFPGLDLNNVVGTCIDVFHKNPSHQRRLLADISSLPYKTEISVSGLEFGLTLIALLDEEGNYIGNAVEWTDFNDRARYKAEVGRLFESVQGGSLSDRGDLEILSEIYQPMMKSINEIIDATVAPIQEASTVLELLANRDLTARVVGDYLGDHAKIKDAVNTAANNLDQGLIQVSSSAEQVNAAAGQISTGSQSLAQGSSEQASSLEEVSSSLQEIASMTKQSSSNAQEAKALSENARISTEKGVDSMNRLSEAIDRIKESSDQTAKILKTIDEIAFQTNLLALNAAVEAARAGDAGKGFAVVAEEVRNLAQRSAEAAKNTADLIEGAVKNAENGVNLNQEVLGNLDEIKDQVNKVSAVMEEIATGSEQQNEGIAQITTGVDQLNVVTQQNAANSEESASASEELSSQATELSSLVAQFKLSVVSNSAPVAFAPRVNGNGHSNGHQNGTQTLVRPALAPKVMIPLDDGDDASLRTF